MPFWLVGIGLIKNKLLNRKSEKTGKSQYGFPVIVSAGLVIIALLAGLIILILGIMDLNTGLIFAGVFFVFVVFTFVLFVLTIQGYFDKVKI